MENADKKTLFKCIYCNSCFLLDFEPPEKWMVRRYAIKSRFKFVCEKCGAFIYPEELCEDRAPDEDIFYMFSKCINAFRCSLHDQYDPSCEAGLLMPKCFY